MPQLILQALMQTAFGLLLGILLFSTVTNSLAKSKLPHTRCWYGAATVMLCAVALWPTLSAMVALATIAASVTLTGALAERRPQAAACACFGDLSKRLQPLLPLIRNLIYGATLVLWITAASAASPSAVPGQNPGLLLLIIALAGLFHLMLGATPGDLRRMPERFPTAAVDWHGLTLTASGGAFDKPFATAVPVGGQCLIVFGNHECVACDALVNRLCAIALRLGLGDTVILAGARAPRAVLACLRDEAMVQQLRRQLDVSVFPTAFLITSTGSSYTAERVLADILGRVVDMAGRIERGHACD